jgi:hypothetical protein
MRAIEFTTPGFGDVHIGGLSPDTLGNVVATGYFWGTPYLHIGFDTLYDDTAHGATNLFVAELSAGGTAVWGVSANGNASIASNDIARDDSGALYICGTYAMQQSIVGGDTLALADTGNAFIAKLSAPWPTRFCMPAISAATLTAYPVPSGGEVWFRLAGTGFNSLTITDVSGKQVEQIYCNPYTTKQEFALPNHRLPPGTYIVTATRRNGNLTQKFQIM